MVRTPVYAQALDVSKFLRLKNADGSDFIPADSPATDPTLAWINSLIMGTEDEWNRRTMHSWFVTSADKEVHDLPVDYEWSWGTPTHLGHRNIVTIDATQGDKVEVWDGTTYQDITANIGSDYQVQYDKGIIYFLGYLFAPIRTNRIRLTYRYGESSVPQDIWLLIVKRVASLLIQTSLTTNQFTFGTDRGVNLQQALKDWQDDFDDGISRYAEWVASDYGF